QDGKRPESITIRLLADGKEVASKTVTAADKWSWKFENLDKYKEGREIIYTITEDVVGEYTSEIKGYDVINTHAPSKTSVQVTKAWDDANDQDGKRPESVKIVLLADGKETEKFLELSAKDKWAGSFTDLDEYKDGKKIVYTIKEVELENGYTASIAGNSDKGFIVTNSRSPELINIEGSKTWNDNNNQDGKRPESITINLLANGKKIASMQVGEKEEWAWEFKDLAKYENKEEISYVISELAVEGYSAKVDGFNIINTHTPGKTSIQVSKSWRDANDKDNVRPKQVTIKLLADGKDTEKQVVLSQDTYWTGTFADLDIYKDGKKISYTVEEVKVAKGYISTVSGSPEQGFVVTNSRTPNKKANPTTGDSLNIAVEMGLVVLAAALLLASKKRKEQIK
ncbi:MAG: Cna B-type domain-containing protein, partial [Tissierellia bacterium]|nr:Cna B-type domain-containing protein [Tissierellia bacterium]